MRKLLNNPWVVAALAGAAIAFVWVSLAPATKSQRVVAAAPVESPDQAPAELPTADAALSSVQDALKQLILPAAPRDPFAVHKTSDTSQVQEKKPEEPDFIDTAHLSGVWTQNGATLLLINDHIRSVGDSIGRFKIESASQEGVWLTHWKGRTFLTLGKSFVLNTPARPTASTSSQKTP